MKLLGLILCVTWLRMEDFFYHNKMGPNRWRGRNLEGTGYEGPGVQLTANLFS